MTSRASGHVERLATALLALCLGACASRAPEPVVAAATGNPWFDAGRAAVAAARARPARSGPARNAIVFIGDGMGVATVTAARIFEGQLRGEPGEENLLSFERLPHVALAKTYNTNLQVPDSAGSMTAMMSGVKTLVGVLGVDETVTPGDYRSVATSRVPTLFEEAERRGLATGIVTTTTITHATPAACYAHAPHRRWEDDGELPDDAREAGFPDLARQLVEFDAGNGIEVALGGGREHFLPRETADPEHADATGKRRDGRDLLAAWRERFPNGATVWNRSQLAAIDPERTGHLLGLFEPSHMNFEVDRPGDPAGEPSLSEMTARALDLLEGHPGGFLLMVEAGRIDHAHHQNNAHRALVEAVELSNAVRLALERTSRDDTLVVVTADHSHVMTFAGYPKRGNDILGLVVSLDARGQPGEEPARDLLGLPYTTLGYANGPGYPGATDLQPEGPKRFPHRPGRATAAGGRPDLSAVDTTDPDYLQETAVPLRSETHGGEDVPIYAGGPGAELFHGVQEQSYVYHAIRAALGWD
ncbi:MAG: alkaline phosphatase [Myxococcota bacterium]|nr:alkaline phosphatase [Myxococcota bacterium]